MIVKKVVTRRNVEQWIVDQRLISSYVKKQFMSGLTLLNIPLEIQCYIWDSLQYKSSHYCLIWYAYCILLLSIVAVKMIKRNLAKLGAYKYHALQPSAWSVSIVGVCWLVGLVAELKWKQGGSCFLKHLNTWNTRGMSKLVQENKNFKNVKN